MSQITKEDLDKFVESLREADFLQLLRRVFQRSKFSTVMILAGLSLLGYVGHEYWAMHREQQELHRQWVAQQTKPASPSTASVVNKDDGLTRVLIPKIDL